MKKKYLLFFFVVITNIGTIHAAVEGALPGEFSVSATLKVHFSQGNLQYQASTKTWRFAVHQYDYIGSSNGNISSTYTGWIDLFAWASSGYKVPPYHNVWPSSGHLDVNGNSSNHMAGTQYDWGVYNKISNGGNVANRWRTLTKAEWEYLINTRSNAVNKRALGSINGINGLIILPDNWTLPAGCSFRIKESETLSGYETNTYTTEQWSKMEEAGAIFLPAAGFREPEHYPNPTRIMHNGNKGAYWSGTATSSYLYAYLLGFGVNSYASQKYFKISVYGESSVAPGLPQDVRRVHGISVRLAQNSSVYDAIISTITTSAVNGTVTGGGAYKNNATATLTATPDECYRFVQWSDGNTDNPRTITVTGNATYTALFEKNQYTITFENADGTTLQTGEVDCGLRPAYIGSVYSIPSPTAPEGYTNVFNGWTPEIVTADGPATYTAVFVAIPTSSIPNVQGVFSVGSSKQVSFSKGNLQYNAALGSHQCADASTKQGTWRFAENQWDYVGNAVNGTVYQNGEKCSNALSSSTYNGWIDLFGWGTSGWNSGANKYQPYYIMSNSSADYYPGGDSNNDLTGDYVYADWGVYNEIGSFPPNTWRTLSSTEWNYMYSERENASLKRSMATVNNVKGFIFLPDNWILPNGIVFTPDATDFTINNYSPAEWFLMESAGAVFLPAAGNRSMLSLLVSIGDRCCYWTSSHNSASATRFVAYESETSFSGSARYYSSSVRLVSDAIYTITTNSEDNIKGTAVGSGTYSKGTELQISALPNECYEFSQWSDGNTDNPRTIIVTGNATYTAEFEQIQYTIEAQSADAGQGSATVTNP